MRHDKGDLIDRTAWFTRLPAAMSFLPWFTRLPAAMSYTAKLKTLYFFFICSAEDLSTLTSNKFRMVYKVDGNP